MVLLFSNKFMNYQCFRAKGFIEEESIRVLSEGNSPEESLDYMPLNAVQWKLPFEIKKTNSKVN